MMKPSAPKIFSSKSSLRNLSRNLSHKILLAKQIGCGKSDEKFTNKNKAPFLDLCMSGNLPQDSEKPLKADLAP